MLNYPSCNYWPHGQPFKKISNYMAIWCIKWNAISISNICVEKHILIIYVARKAAF